MTYVMRRVVALFVMCLCPMTAWAQMHWPCLSSPEIPASRFEVEVGNDFSPQNQFWFVWLQGWIFINSNATTEFFYNQGYTATQLFYNKETDARALLAVHPTHAILNWDGTSSIKDGIIDFTFHQSPQPGLPGVFHEGVRQQYAALEVAVRRAVARLPPGLPIFVTGHSLGGAVAALSAYRLASYGFNVQTYISANPLPGNPAFAAAYNALLGDKTYRLVNGADLVPKAPPAREAEEAALGILADNLKPHAKYQFELIDFAQVGNHVFTYGDDKVVHESGWKGEDDIPFWIDLAEKNKGGLFPWAWYIVTINARHAPQVYVCDLARNLTP